MGGGGGVVLNFVFSRHLVAATLLLAMTGGGNDAAGAGGAVGKARSSALEKDLRELERLLKADQQTGATSKGGAGGGEEKTLGQQLGSVLRKLMEAYFTPLNGESHIALCSPSLTPFARSTRAACIKYTRPLTRQPDARQEREGPLFLPDLTTFLSLPPFLLMPLSLEQFTRGRRGLYLGCSRWPFSVTPVSSRAVARYASAPSRSSCPFSLAPDSGERGEIARNNLGTPWRAKNPLPWCHDSICVARVRLPYRCLFYVVSQWPLGADLTKPLPLAPTLPLPNPLHAQRERH